MIRTCPAHGPFEGRECPTCEHRGEPLIREEARTRLSKFLSGALRHFPDDVGLSVDEQGWASRSAILEAARANYDWVTDEQVLAVLALDPNDRFELEEQRVRATYGHSIPVELETEPSPVPPRLYHGTVRDNLASIREEGLQPMTRQHVHLSPDVETAREVGRRHGDEVVVLAIDARGLGASGIDVTRRAATVYTCERVPPEHIERADA